MKNFKKLVLAATLALTASFASASVVQHTSGTFGVMYDGVSNSGGRWSSDFDVAEFHFASEYVDTIQVSSPHGYLHSHGAPVSALLDVYNGTNWINVFTSGTTHYANIFDIFANPVHFDAMNITGLRMRSSSYVDQAFHWVSSDTTYTLSGTPAEVPEPSSMLLIGLGIAGVAAMRRKKA